MSDNTDAASSTTAIGEHPDATVALTEHDLPHVVEVEYPSTGMRSLYGPFPTHAGAQDFADRAEPLLTDPASDDDTPNVAVVVVNPATLRHFTDSSHT